MSKIVIFVRHGQAEHNVAFDEYGEEAYYDDKYTYSSLTTIGKEQALELRTKLKEIDFDFVLTSPLDRCIQTTNILFPNLNNIVSNDLVRENDYNHPCNGRRLKSELEKLYKRIKFDINEYDVKFLKKVDDVKDRIDELDIYLEKNNFKTICIISHHSFIKKFFKDKYDKDVILDNCQYYIHKYD